MLWLLYCGLFLVMLISIFRMLNRQGKWAWAIFLGLLGSVVAYVVLFVLPVASAAALQDRKVLLTVILIGGTVIYAGLMLYFVRRMAAKMKTTDAPP